jgi:hypothetical protein
MITKRGSKGGYVERTIIGEIVLRDETVSFTNGEFKFKLTPSSF